MIKLNVQERGVNMTKIKEILEKMYNIENLNSPKLAEIELFKSFQELSDEDISIIEFNKEDALLDIDFEIEKNN